MIYELTVSCEWDLPDEQRIELGFTEKDWAGNWDRQDENPMTIEINTLEELQEFIKKWGQVIVKENEIEIYNGYRE